MPWEYELSYRLLWAPVTLYYKSPEAQVRSCHLAQSVYLSGSCPGILCHGDMSLTRHSQELFGSVMIDVCRGEDHRRGRGGIKPGRIGNWEEMTGIWGGLLGIGLT